MTTLNDDITPMKPTFDIVGYGAAVLAVALWAFAFPTSKLAQAEYEFHEVVFLRYLVASLFFVGMAMVGRVNLKAALSSRRDLIWLGFLGLVGITTYHNLFTAGIASETSASAAIVIAAVPVMSAIVARTFFGEKLTGLGWIGICIAISGIAVIFVAKGGSLSASIGLVLLLGAALCSAIYFSFQRKLSSGIDAMTLTAVSAWIATVPLLIFLPDTIEKTFSASLQITLMIGTMGVLSSGAGYALWFFALKRLPVAQVTSVLFLQPAIAATLGWIMAGEAVTGPVVLSALITVGGVALVVFKGKIKT